MILGRSTEGRAIRAVRLGDPDSPRKVVVVGSIHGDEREGLRVTRRIRALRVRGVDLWVVDSFNPDGLAAGTRQNARGVDLNRNFPYRWRARRHAGDRYWSGPRPLSERESRVVRRWLLRIRPDVTVWYHQPWGACSLRATGRPGPAALRAPGGHVAQLPRRRPARHRHERGRTTGCPGATRSSSSCRRGRSRAAPSAATRGPPLAAAVGSLDT